MKVALPLRTIVLVTEMGTTDPPYSLDSFLKTQNHIVRALTPKGVSFHDITFVPVSGTENMFDVSPHMPWMTTSFMESLQDAIGEFLFTQFLLMMTMR